MRFSQSEQRRSRRYRSDDRKAEHGLPAVQRSGSMATICTQCDADPSDRTEFIHHWDDWPADPGAVIQVLNEAQTVDALRSALYCVIGLHSEDEEWKGERESFVAHLTEGYETRPAHVRSTTYLDPLSRLTTSLVRVL